ncbi:protein kinase [Streptomyces sp. NPDC020801]|uniref:protein kinase domain-containing protein n=1 Tax=Streptomyces sp. NPDC020801 TaxID=3365093 RepID=UPI0037A8EE50
MSRHGLAPEDPQRLGEYWLAGRLGSGGQGVVYEAYDAAGMRVAVKVLHWDTASGTAARRRFAKEVTATQRVASFCTARVLAANPDTESPYIVGEFVPGPDLRAAVQRSGPLRGDDLLRLATGVATALAAIHQAGVVHRDLKPGNVLLGPDGPRVIDFGIARTPEMTLTETGAVVGTFGYMAPETLQGRRAGTPADVFAWGALVLFAATGEEPFWGANIGEVVVRALEHEPDLTVLPEPLPSVVSEALAKRPEDRPSATAILLRLLGGGYDDQQALRAGADAAAGMHAPGGAAATTVLSLGDAAEAASDALPPAVHAVAREVWLRLIVPGSAPDGSHDSVRTAAEDELLSGRPTGEQAVVREAIAMFTGAGLLIHEAAAVRPVSAAVLRAWPRLREWVDADREGLRLHRRLGEAARVWHQHGRRPEDLEGGTALRKALDWAATAPSRLRPNLLERQFLTASRTADTRRLRRRRALVGGTVLFAVLALVAGAFAWQQNRASERQSLLAEARRVASVADSLRSTDPVAAMRLSVTAWRLADTAETRSALIGAMTQREGESFSAPNEAELPYAAWPHLTSDGRTLLTMEKNHVIRWDVAGRRQVDRLAVPGVQAGRIASASDDAQTVAVYGDGGAQVWDLARGRRIWEQNSSMPLLQVSPSGRMLVLDDTRRGTARLWDPGRQRTLFESTEVYADGAAISPNDRIAAFCSRSGLMELWDVARGTRWQSARTAINMGKCQGRPSTETSAVKFSTDNSTVALIASGSGVRVWDISSGKERRIRRSGVEAFALSKDGKFVATASRDEILLWRLNAPSEPIFRYSLLNESVSQIRVDVDSGRIRYLSGEWSPTVSVRSLNLGQAAATGWRTEPLQAAAFSADGRFLGVTWDDHPMGRFQIREGLSGKLISDLPGIRIPPRNDKGGVDSVRLLSFSPDAQALAYAVATSSDQERDRIRVWNIMEKREEGSLYPTGPDESPVSGLTFTADGKRLMVSRLNDGIEQPEGIDVWDRRLRAKFTTLEGDALVGNDWPRSFALRPDGGLLVTNDGLIRLPEEKAIRKDLSREAVTAIAFGPEKGRSILAVGDASGGVTMWDGDVSHRLGMLPGRFDGSRRGIEAVNALAFSHGGRTLAVGGSAGTVQLWDVASNQRLGSALPTPGDAILSLTFGTDDTLYAAGAHVLHQRYVLDPQHSAREVCRRVGGGPSRSEWETYIRGLPYRKVCS